MAGQVLRVLNPFDEEVVFEAPMATRAEAEAAVSRAQCAAAGWRRVPVAERVALCERFMTAFEAMKEDVARRITLEMGKPLQQARGEVNGMLDRARHMCAITEATLADEYLPEKAGFVRYIRHEPKGVVLDIAAWNYPLLIAVNVVVPGVLAGNSVIIKHSSKTPSCGRAFVEAFQKAGAPENLVQDLLADHVTTEALIKHPGVGHVSFTGSVRGGTRCRPAPADASSTWASSWAARTRPTCAPTRPSTSPSRTAWTVRSTTRGNPAAPSNASISTAPSTTTSWRPTRRA